MGIKQQIIRQLKPLFKGLPVIGLILLGALFIARQIIKYTPTMYLTVSKIKLDTRKFGVSNNMLYKDFDVFTSENKVETEAEILGSHLLIKKALKKVDFQTHIERVGKIKRASLYKNSPFQFHYKLNNELLHDKSFTLTIKGNQFTLRNKELLQPFEQSAQFDEWIMINGNQIMVSKNDSLIAQQHLDLSGEYAVVIFSEEGLINKIKQNLQVQAVDKENDRIESRI